MADNTRDVALNLAVNTTGTDQVEELAKQLDKLAKEGGDAAPEFQKLADELRKVGEQAKAVETVGQLEQELNKSAEAFTAARTELEKLDTTLTQQTQSTQSYRDQLNAAKQAVNSIKDQLIPLQAELRLLRSTSDEATKSTDEYKNKVLDLNRMITPLKNALIEQGRAVQQASEALRESARETLAAERAQARAADSARRLETSYKEQRNAIDQAKTEMSSLGLATEDLSKAQEEIVASADAARRSTAALVEALNAERLATERAAQAERELADQKAFEKKAQEAQQLVRAGEYVQFWETELAKAEKAERDLAEQTLSATRQIRESFSTVGVQSVADLRNQITQVKNAMDLLRTSGTLSGNELREAMRVADGQVKQLERDIREATGALTAMDRATEFFKSVGAQVGIGVTAVQALAQAAVSLGTSFFEANAKMEQMRRGLTAVYGDAKVAAEQIDFLRQVANKAGVSVTTISSGFTQFAASATAAGIPMQNINGLFAAVTQAAGSLGLSGEKVTDMLNALGQMAAKGTVQMEELRGQLGDALPGALAKVAQGLGLTEAELVKLVEKGGLSARDIFPALEQSLKSLGGETNTMTATFARLKNTATEAAQVVGDTGVWAALTYVVQALGGALRDVLYVFVSFERAVALTGRTIGLVGAALTGQIGSFKQFKEELSAILDDEAGKLDKVKDRLYQNQAATQNLATTTTQAGNAIQTAGQQAATASGQIQGNAQAQTGAAAAATQNAQAQAGAGAAAGQAGQQAGQATTRWYQLRVAYEANEKAILDQVAIAKDLVHAKEIEAQSLAQIANLSGDETLARNAASKAADGNAQASARLADMQSHEVQILQAKYDALKNELAITRDSDPVKKKELSDLAETIKVKTAEAQKYKEAAELRRLEAEAAKLSIQTLKDNSAAFGELKNAYDQAQAALKLMQEAEAAGTASQEDVNAAMERSAAAARLYADALADVARNAQLKVQAVKADYDTASAGLTVRAQEARASEQVAKAIGDERSAVDAKIQQKRIEIDQVRLAQKEKLAEADATIKALQAERDAIRGSDDVSVAKRKEIDLRIQSEQAKIKEAAASDSVVKGIQAEIDALYRQANAAGQAASALDGLAQREKDIADQQAAQQADADRINSQASDNSYIFQLKDKVGKGQLGASDYNAVKAAYDAEKFNLEMMQRNPGVYSYAGQQGTVELYNVARRAFEEVSSAKALEDRKQAASQTPTSTQQTDTGNPANGNTSHTVTINIGGKSATINAASAPDAANLAGILQQLNYSANRSSV